MASPESLPDDDGLEGLLARIAREVRASRPPAGMTTRIVAIDGQGGSGKSGFALHLSRALGGVQIIQTDDFASWDNPIDWWPQLLEQVLVPLSKGEPARFERSHWGGERDGELVVVEPAEFVILEGVTASRDAFAPYVTYSIWVEAPRGAPLAAGARSRRTGSPGAMAGVDGGGRSLPGTRTTRRAREHGGPGRPRPLDLGRFGDGVR